MKALKHRWIFFMLILCVKVVSGTGSQASLLKQFEQTTEPNERVNLLLQLGDYYVQSKPDSAIFFYQQAVDQAREYESESFSAVEKEQFYQLKALSFRKLLLALNNSGDNDRLLSQAQELLEMASKRNDSLSIVTSYSYFGALDLYKGNYPQAIDHFIKAYEITHLLNDSLEVARIAQNIGVANFYMGNLELAAKFTLESHEYYSDLDHLLGKASCLLMLGNLQYDLDDLNKALNYYNEAYLGFEELGHTNGKYNTILNIGAILIEEGRYQEAIERFEEAIALATEINDQQGVVRCLHNIGMSFSRLNQPDQALQYYQEALQIARSHNMRHLEANTLSNMAGVNNDLGHFNTALGHASRSLELSREIQSLDDQLHAYHNLSRAQEGLGNFRQALEYHKLFKHFSDSLNRMENLREISRVEAQFQNERMRQEVELKNTQLEKQELEIASQSLSLGRQRMIRNILIIGFVLLASVLAYIYSSLLRRKRTNAFIMQQNQEIITQHQEITHQKAIIEDKNEAMVSSIRYAQNIQKTLLPDEPLLQDLLGQMFVIYEPKEIVSGDFYWIGKQNGITLLALADSTGHGVPGAFMSVMGMSFLNEFVARRKYASPSQLLDEMRLYIISSLHQQGDYSDSPEGIEMALVAIDHQNHSLTYSGARTPLFVASKNTISLNGEPLPSTEGPVFKIKGDQMPLSFHRKMRAFSNQSIQLQANDMVYMMTDGLADQFGTKARERFTNQRALKLLEEVYHMPLCDQKDRILETFHAWKKDCEQVDDMAVIGFRI
ncbi:MAG: tetratricopeptide repeat protein [Bacteroidales bacterium]|nr:tetratricopeptide repeat protein [Bacteroidales bacterium]